ncbi:MFS transporter [Amycolatopsis sp. w19]|uniref:MFS transporter n=1 Tax=Amycolatopsis sp. w19 TaxID=3448134 RepID=UPI003F1B125A
MRRVGGAGLVDSLRVGEFRALWSAEGVSILGDQLARVALAVLVFDRTSSAVLTALTYALTFVPAVLGGFLLSGLADRFPRKRVLVLTDLVRAGLAAAMAVPGMPLWLLWALVGLLTMASAPFKAAQLALLPDVLGDDRYQAGLALRQMTVQIAQVAGFGLGGILVGVLSPSGALVVDAVTFGLSALIIAAGVRPNRAGKEGAAEEVDPAAQRRGIDFRLAVPFILGALIGLFVVPEGLAAPYAGALGAGTVAIGLLMAADPVGSVIGAWWAAKTSSPATPTQRAVVVPAALAGIPLVACAFLPGIGWSITLWALSGVFSTIYLIRLQPMIVAVVPDSRRGAVMGRFSTTVYAGQGVAILGGGAVAELIGPKYTVAVAGVLATVLVVAVGAAWKMARPRRVRITEDEPAQADQATRRPSDFLVTHRGLLPGRPAEGGGPAGQEAATSETGPSSEGNGSAVSMQGKSQSAHDGSPIGRVGWSVWSHSLYARAFIVFIEMAAIAAVGVSAALDPPSWADVRVCLFVMAFGVIAAELARSVERRRRRFADTPHVNFSSVWTLAGALILSPSLAAVLAVVLYVHLWLRCSRGVAGTFVSRFAFNAANVILSCQVAGWLAKQMHLAPMTHEFDGSDALACAAVVIVYFTVNSLIAAITIAIVRLDRTATRLLGPFSENALELATLCMGVVTALLLSMHPTLVVLIFVPLYALHRSVLIRQFEHAATIDSKTGLLNSTAWHALAEAEFARAERNGTRVGVLMIDLDHFRRINNAFGHQAGDRALRAVGQVLQSIGGEDCSGRFGGEEFVVILPDVTQDELRAVADRTCEAIFGLRVDGIHDHAAGDQHPLSASIGAALYPDTGKSLEDVLLAADLALFAAKDGGRNQVRMMTSTA